ncbi:MAG: metallophosphoesterase family protein [Patescibacteria group bacterium]|nr:metallophosphoesterase family protein [Patescibacteria group bacterium]
MSHAIECNTLVVSDIHLGSKVSRGEKFVSLLQSTKFKTLVINGDLFDSNDIERLEKIDWQIMSTLTDLAKNHRVILIEGNHGRKLDSLAKKMGLELRHEYLFKVGNRDILCMHGHEFDIYIKHFPLLTRIVTATYYTIQELGGQKQRASMVLKKMSKRLLRVSGRQERLARNTAQKYQGDIVICSHTHMPYFSEKNGIKFLNSGSFCANPCTYITIDNNGNTELREL